MGQILARAGPGVDPTTQIRVTCGDGNLSVAIVFVSVDVAGSVMP